MNKEKIIDYIYNEMNPSERSDFEKMMAEDASLRIEVEQLIESRTLIAQELDYLPPLEEVKAAEALSIKSVSVSKWWAIAASLLLLCAMSFLTGLRIGVQDNSLVIGFGEVKLEKKHTPEAEYISKAEFSAAVVKLEKSLNSIREKPQSGSINKEDIENMINESMRNLDKKYKTWSKETYIAYHEDTKRHTEDLMKEFLEYYEINRAEDINQINNVLTNLALMIQENTEALPMYAYQPAQ
jgi:molecular chaperone DnaK (HSP70)